MILCNKVKEVPPCLAESQQTVSCPDCEDYNCGSCDNLTRVDGNTCYSFMQATECEQTIIDRIVQRTAGRIRFLQVEAIDNRVVIRGCAPSYYLKQLALRGARDVLGSAAAIRIELNVEVSGAPRIAQASTFVPRLLPKGMSHASRQHRGKTEDRRGEPSRRRRPSL
jgi:hypothetical protein